MFRMLQPRSRRRAVLVLVAPLLMLMAADTAALSPSDGDLRERAPAPQIATDLDDYAPGSTAIVTITGFERGATVAFEVDHVSDPGADSLWGTPDDVTVQLGGAGHEPWRVTDGSAADRDGAEDGSIETAWYVNPDDSYSERFLITGQIVEAGNDGMIGTGDDVRTGFMASNTFTDCYAVGSGTTALNDWTRQSSGIDHSGTTAFNSFQYADDPSKGHIYEEDRYENWDPLVQGAGDTDIVEFSAGYDGDFYYFEFDLREPWNYDGTGQSRSYNLEIEADEFAGGDSRSDFFATYIPSTTDVGSTWIDVGDPGISRLKVWEDTNDDVGGSTPGSDKDTGTGGDGFDGDFLAVSGKLYARILNGNIEIAIHKTFFGSENIRARGFSTQTSTLSKDKMLIHDQFTESDLTGFRFDMMYGEDKIEWNTAGACPINADIGVTKSVEVYDPDGSGEYAIPGRDVIYTITVTNNGSAVDASTLEIVDPLPPELIFFRGAFDGTTTEPVKFVDGTPSSTLACCDSTHILYSVDGGANYSYLAPAGYDAAITHLKVVPGGSMADSGTSFEIKFRAQIK